VTRRSFLGAAAAGLAAAPPARSGMGLSPDCFGISRAPRTAYEYLQYGHERGAGGVQAVLTSFDPDSLKKIRARAEEYGMYLEITTNMPKPDEDWGAFEQTVKAAKDAGARCLRSVCLSGRRYENFSSLDEWKTFAAAARAHLERAARIVERHRIPIGIENHKDWTLDEMVPLLERYGGPYLGVCLDWGNNLALLDDPVEVVNRLAPFVVNSHIKDMAVEEYPEGFLLAEVPAGQGFFDMKSMLAVIRKARPDTRFSLDMLTRDPLKIPCLTDRYWATFPERNGKYLAKALTMVRANRPRRPIPRVTSMDRAAAMELEQANVRQSLDYARDELGLR
jgi:sugar phosphate isomerase/epimerase